MTDIVSDIKARIDLTAFDLTTAEGRRDLDNTLRAEMREIADDSLRAHAAEMLKAWRWELFGTALVPLNDPYLRRLDARMTAIERRIGINRQREITSLKGGADG